MTPVRHFVRKNFDDTALIAALAHVSLAESAAELTEADHAVLAALRRSSNALRDAPLEDVQSYLTALDEDQLPGLVSNVKGILHEMEFVRIENGDGDSVYASYFDATNHPDTDIVLTDSATGASWQVQLKATDDASYVQDWIDAHPDGQIAVTTELADKLGLPDTGLSNAELTTNVEDFVDKLLERGDDMTIWDHFPALTLASVSMIVWALWKRYRRGEIPLRRFKTLATLATGLKAAKIGVLMTLLSVPVVREVTAAVLIARVLASAHELFRRQANELQETHVAPALAHREPTKLCG